MCNVWIRRMTIISKREEKKIQIDKYLFNKTRKKTDWNLFYISIWFECECECECNEMRSFIIFFFIAHFMLNLEIYYYIVCIHLNSQHGWKLWKLLRHFFRLKWLFTVCAILMKRYAPSLYIRYRRRHNYLEEIKENQKSRSSTWLKLIMRYFSRETPSYILLIAYQGHIDTDTMRK